MKLSTRVRRGRVVTRPAGQPERPHPRGNAFEPTRQLVLARDGRRCQLRLDGCVGHADQVDHIVRVIDGGGDEPANLRAACGPCNRKRGDQ